GGELPAGVVHEDVGVAQRGFGGRDERGDLLDLADVARRGEELRARRAVFLEIVQRLVELLFLPSADRDLRAELHERGRGREADAAPAAGDDGDFVFEETLAKDRGHWVTGPRAKGSRTRACRGSTSRLACWPLDRRTDSHRRLGRPSRDL